MIYFHHINRSYPGVGVGVTSATEWLNTSWSSCSDRQACTRAVRPDQYQDYEAVHHCNLPCLMFLPHMCGLPAALETYVGFLVTQTAVRVEGLLAGTGGQESVSLWRTISGIRYGLRTGYAEHLAITVMYITARHNLKPKYTRSSQLTAQLQWAPDTGCPAGADSTHGIHTLNLSSLWRKIKYSLEKVLNNEPKFQFLLR